MNATGLYLLFCAAFAIATGTASAQLPQYALSRIQEEGGLRTADVTNMTRDRKGFLWLSTQSAVFGFDGKHTLRFPFSESVNRVSVDAKDRKWVSTRGGLNLLNELSRQFALVPFEGETKAAVAQWFTLNDGNIYAFRGGKHFWYDEAKGRFVPKPLPFSSGGIRITQFFGQHGEFVFYGNGDTIVRYHSSLPMRIIPAKNINGVFVINEEEILVSDTRYRTYRITVSNANVRLLETTAQPLFGDKLVCFSSATLDGETYWFASNKGLFQYQPKTARISRPVLYHLGRPLENQSSISSLFTDAEGTLYMNSAEGIFMLNKTSAFIQHVRNYQYGTQTLPDNNVRSIAEDRDGNIWLGTTGGIAELNPATGILKSFNPLSGQGLIDYPSYRQLLPDGDVLWLGTSGNGVWYYNRKTGVCKRPTLLLKDSVSLAAFNRQYIWKLVMLSNGKLLAAAGTNLYLIDRKTFTASLINYKIPAGTSRSAAQDANGRIWLGTSSGLVCFDSTFQPLFRLRDSLPDGRVASFCDLHQGYMLIGTRGLYEARTTAGKVISFTQKKAIPPEQLIYCMQQDRQGFVWLGTDDGLYRYNPAKDEAVRFDESDGVQSQSFNSNGAFLSSKGILYMGGKNGFNYLRPDAYVPQAEKLRPIVLSFSVAVGDSIYTSLPKEIPYYGRNLDFVISAPELKKPFRLQYRYRLGNDAWTFMGFTNHVRISSLKPNDYTLQVAASYDGKQWFDSATVYSFTVLTPWWQTTWFRTLIVVVIILTVWRWNVYRRHRREREELERMMKYFSYPGTEHASVDLLLWDIARNCISGLGLEDCVIYLLDEERNVLVQKAACGDKAPSPYLIANPIEIPVGKGITGTVAESGKAMIIPDTTNDSRYIEDDAARLSEIAVPILHDGRVIGVIDSEHRKKNFFSTHHLNTLQTVASLCSSKIATAVATEAVRKAEGELQVLEGKMTEAKFTNLRLQMNPHFLFNILTTIQYLIVSNQLSKATKYVNIFSGFLRSILYHAENSVVTLEEELRILKLYVELESLCLDETFEWNIHVGDDIETEDVLVPFMLLQPFVENAIHHGLMHKPGTKKFTIQIGEDDEASLRCTIEDNGIGRNASTNINSRSFSKLAHQSKGIGIVEKRLRLLQQKTGKQACFSIEDLAQNGVASGTRVNIIIPNYLTVDV